MRIPAAKNLFGFFSGRREEAKPVSCVQVELTNHCNYSCANCPQSLKKNKAPGTTAAYDRPTGFMDFGLYRRVIDQVNELGAEVNFSFFGEPTSHPEFLKFMDYLKGRNPEVRVVMNTNLSYATREIFAKLIEIGLGDLRLSIDAATAGTYDMVRPGRFYVGLDGAERHGGRFETICAKAEYWFSLPAHTPTRHVYTVSSKNRHETGAFVRRWLPLLGEKDIILTKSVLTYGGKMSDSEISPNPCNAWDINMLTVDWQGNVSPCNLDVNMELAIGSVKEKTLLELKDGSRYRELKRLSLEKKITPCDRCVDGNNWTKNAVYRKGDEWTEAKQNLY